MNAFYNHNNASRVSNVFSNWQQSDRIEKKMLGVTTSYNTAADISRQEPHPFKGGFYLLSEGEDQNLVSPQLPCMDLMSSANHFAKQLVLSDQ